MLGGLIAAIWLALAVLVCLGVCAAAARPTPESKGMEAPRGQSRARAESRCRGALAKEDDSGFASHSLWFHSRFRALQRSRVTAMVTVRRSKGDRN